MPKRATPPGEKRKPPANAWKKGVSANPAGRPKGSVTRFSLTQAKKVASEGVTPLQFLLTVMRGDAAQLKELRINYKPSTKDRVDAAKAAAPYCHRKMPIGIDNGRGGPIGVYTPEQLAKLSDEELDKLAIIMGKLAVFAQTEESKVAQTGASLGSLAQAASDEDDGD